MLFIVFPSFEKKTTAGTMRSPAISIEASSITSLGFEDGVGFIETEKRTARVAVSDLTTLTHAIALAPYSHPAHDYVYFEDLLKAATEYLGSPRP